MEKEQRSWNYEYPKMVQIFPRIPWASAVVVKPAIENQLLSSDWS